MTTWREHPRLVGRFHEEYPDDLQVLVHDGHPALSGRAGEVVWARVVGAEGDVFRAQVLNKPNHLQTVAEGDEIQFIVPSGGKYPLQVTPRYLAERNTWRLLIPCSKCGLTELLSPARDLVAHTFPGVGEDELRNGFMFTSPCGQCGGKLVVRIKRAKSGA